MSLRRCLVAGLFSIVFFAVLMPLFIIREMVRILYKTLNVLIKKISKCGGSLISWVLEDKSPDRY